MIKPIFVIRIPLSHKNEVDGVCRSINDTIKEQYNLLFILDELVESFTFECYNGDNISESDFQGIKERLTILMESALFRIGEERDASKKKLQIEEEKRREKDIKKKPSQDPYGPLMMRPWESNPYPPSNFYEKVIKFINNE